jgi:rhomboid protease GluP
LVAPSSHRAVGASTAVFAALGMLTGFAWQTRFVHLGPRERLLRRSSPVIAGLALLVLLGDGAEHVDVVGHICGFLCGTALGWSLSHFHVPRSRVASVQWVAGGAALALLCSAWLLALQTSFARP